MKKYKKFIFPIICVLVVVITFALLFDLRNKVEEKNYNVNDIEVENIIDEENEIENEVSNTNVVNEISENNTTNTSAYEEDEEIGSTSKIQEAINLVKEKWGNDNTVTFRCDNIKSNGEYVIAVVSKTSASVKTYFKVNLDKQTVDVVY